MYIKSERIKDSLYLTAENSGASLEYARGSVVGVVSTLQAVGMQFREAWFEVIKCLPDKVRVEAIPFAFLNLEGTWSPQVIKALVDGRIVKFPDLLKEIPEDMRKKNSQYHESWICRDDMLDKYLHICSIFQRETEREYHTWREQMNSDPALEPKLVYSFAPFRIAGSQHIAEWAVSDLRKNHENTINWHGQNTSRWLYAGCLLVDKGRVSIHT